MTNKITSNCNACGITGTAVEIMPVIKVDNKLIGNGMPGNVTRKIISLFRDLVKG